MVNRRPCPRARGFTLVELLMVMVIMGIIAPVVAVFIVQPIQGYIALDTRAELTDAADSALRLMAREIRSALPNSVRTGTLGASPTPNVIELIHAADGARYRANPGPVGSNPLRVGVADGAFQLVGAFHNLPTGAALANGERLVVYNLGAAGYNAYTAAGAAGVMTAAGNSITLGAIDANGEQLVTLGGNHTFPAPGSPRQRIFVVDGAITYACEGGALVRYNGYGYLAAINTTAGGPAGAASAMASNFVTGCSFSYTPGTATRSGVVTLSLSLTRNGETVNLLRQVRVDNAS